MPTTYEMIRAAIERKQSVSAEYNGYVREMCPHTLGLGKKGEEQCLFFQFAGESSKGLTARRRVALYSTWQGDNPENLRRALAYCGQSHEAADLCEASAL